MVDHNLSSSHNVVFSNSDASTWCYKCESYITNEHLQKLRSMFSAYKFGDQNKLFISKEKYESHDKSHI